MKAPESPYLTAPEAALYLRFEHADGSPNLNAFYIARHRHNIRGHRRGWRLLFRRADLEAFLEDGARAVGRPALKVVHGHKVGGGAR
jgi:hypothetical protein